MLFSLNLNLFALLSVTYALKESLLEPDCGLYVTTENKIDDTW